MFVRKFYMHRIFFNLNRLIFFIKCFSQKKSQELNFVNHFLLLIYIKGRIIPFSYFEIETLIDLHALRFLEFQKSHF